MIPTGSGAPRVAVVGAGIVGCAVAYALAQRGADVVLLDRDAPGSGCSAGNSGAISPASVAPVAMPGLLRTVPTMLADRASPLHLPLAYLPSALPWLARFVASARIDRVRATAARLAALHADAVARHAAMTREVGVPELFLQRGHLHVYPDEAAVAKDALGWQLREAHGHRVERLDADGIGALEPRLGRRYRAGRFLPDQATILDPRRYVEAIARAFVDHGGRLRCAEVRALQPLAGQGGAAGPGGAAGLAAAGAHWRVATGGSAAALVVDQVVVAAGAWSQRLLSPLGLRFPLEAQRGYHVRFEGAQSLVSRTVVLADRKVFVTPMADGLRVGGTVEIAGLQRPPDWRRAAILERIARETFDGLDGAPVQRWMGHRPCLPDSLPVVGPADGYPGLWLAFGHGHLGLTQSLATAERIADGACAAVRSR